MRRLTTLLATVILFTTATVGAQAPTTLNDFFLPGSQPGQSGNLESPGRCDNCHGGYDIAVEPAFGWRGSMMAQAQRDPIYLATMSIANQDAPESGDLCLRCHTPEGWLSGRSTPTDGSALIDSDREGIHCDFCHKLVRPTPLGVNPYPDDPNYSGETYAADQAYISALTDTTSVMADGMYIADSDNGKRGPFVDADARHQFFYSPFHSEALICATCHDVSNPVFSRAPSGKYEPNAFDEPAPDFSQYELFPVERTYSEWSVSAYNTPEGVEAPQFGGNLTIVRTCQDCHMRDVTGVGANKSGTPTRDNLPLHDMTGGNTFMPALVQALYPNEVDADALQAGVDRARYMLQNAASLSLSAVEDNGSFDLTARVTNETGHKLPSGYPEGRRMWINVRAYSSTDQLIYESGHYDPQTAELSHDAEVKIYEIKPGISTTLAPVVGKIAGPSFHFVLNDTIYSDNRIPPRGFTNAAFESIQSPPVDYVYADGQYWDETHYSIPGATARVEANIYYQTTSKEYAEFLRDENVTDDWGTIFYDLWSSNGMSSPELMVAGTLDLTPISGNEPPVAVCPETTTAPAATGTCEATVEFVIDVIDDQPGATVSADPPSGSTFPVGTTTVTVTAIDAEGLTDICTFDVTVNDTELPVPTCPEDIVVSNDPGGCDAVVEFAVSAADNCPGATAEATPASGSTFPVGTTQVDVTATDASNNTQTCSFNVTVNDTELPVPSCPEDIVVPNDPGGCDAVVEFAVSAADNCPGVTVEATPASGSTFPIGTTQVNVTATDPSNNTQTCSFNVTVNDTEPPVPNCPEDIVTPPDEGGNTAVVEFVVSASDNCPGVSVTADPPSGAVFDPGITTVEVVATDGASLTSVCTFTVTVTGADSDGDGHPDEADNCPLVYNPDQTDSDTDGIGDDCDICPGFDDLADSDTDGVPDGCDNCPDTYNPDQIDLNGNQIGDACEGCCVGRVGDANGLGGDEPTIGDVSVMIDSKFITGSCDGILECLTEADINQSGAPYPTCDDITIGDISILIDYLFITGPSLGLPDCL